MGKMNTVQKKMYPRQVEICVAHNTYTIQELNAMSYGIFIFLLVLHFNGFLGYFR